MNVRPRRPQQSLYRAAVPEGHTIHRIASRQRDAFAGAPVRAHSPQGRFSVGASLLDGKVLEQVDAFGKHLIYGWEGRLTLHVHLGLVGKFRTHPAPVPPPSAATRLVLENDTAAAYLTGPMKCELIDRSAADGIIGRLGPDPLRRGTRVTEFVRRIAGDERPVAAALLDQSVISGIGNVYRSEIPFLLGIHPSTPVSDLASDQIRALWSTAREELRHGVADGQIITVRPGDVGATRRSNLPPAVQRYVYKREHKPCLRCRTPIQSMALSGRRVWWCPSCQPIRGSTS